MPFAGRSFDGGSLSGTATSAPLSPSLLPSPIVFLLLPRFTAIAFSSAIEPLRIANRYVPKAYQWTVASVDGAPVADGNGMRVAVDGALADVDAPGALFVCADRDAELLTTPTLIASLRRLAVRGVRLGGIDTGAHVLGRAGLLDGRRATLHWENSAAFAEQYAGRVELARSLFEFDGDRVTCAGGTAAIDMMLHVIERDHGRDLAVRVSEHVMHARIRGGSESQRHTVAERFGVHHPKLTRAIELMESECERPMATEAIADAVRLSTRQLLRLFRTGLGVSPTRFYLRVRLERAHRLIVQSDLSLLEVALACGFQSQSHFSRAFRANYGYPPVAARRTDARPA